MQTKGLMTYPASDIGVFLKTKRNISRPDMRKFILPQALENIIKMAAMKPSLRELQHQYVICGPRAEVTLELTSSRVEDPPKIYANYLSATRGLDKS